MSRKRNQNEAQPHKIYVLISAVSDEFFVGKTTAATPDVAYKFHAAEKHAQTRELFIRSRRNQSFPKMYLLEEINVTPITAFGYCVAWTKYFMEHGLIPLTNQTVLSYTEGLTEENEAVYNCIKDVPITSVLSSEHLLKEKYKGKEKKQVSKKDEKKDPVVTLHLTPNNYELISHKAKEAKMSMSKYCQTMAINGYVASINAWEYLEELRRFKGVLRQILMAILQHGKYYPADLSNILKLLEMVNDGQKNVVKSLEQQTEKLVGYKKLKAENYRLKQKIKELEKAQGQVTVLHPEEKIEQKSAREEDKK